MLLYIYNYRKKKNRTTLPLIHQLLSLHLLSKQTQSEGRWSKTQGTSQLMYLNNTPVSHVTHQGIQKPTMCSLSSYEGLQHVSLSCLNIGSASGYNATCHVNSLCSLLVLWPTQEGEAVRD